MLCSKPFKPVGKMEFGCGQCLPCRLNKLRLWTGRILLESLQHKTALFVTLTYNNVHMPEDGQLQPDDLRLFIKRLRRSANVKIRYFGVGEYGDNYGRPHFHVAIFGDLETDIKDGKLRCLVVERCWMLGYVHIGRVTPESAAYITKYTLKRTWELSELDMGGLQPEFVRMSLKPGIGREAVKTFATGLIDRKGCALIAKKGDVVTEFMYDGKKYSLGRYLTRELRDELGREKRTPMEMNLKRSAERWAESDEARESRRQQHRNVAINRARLKRSQKHETQ